MKELVQQVRTVLALMREPVSLAALVEIISAIRSEWDDVAESALKTLRKVYKV